MAISMQSKRREKSVSQKYRPTNNSMAWHPRRHGMRTNQWSLEDITQVQPGHLAGGTNNTMCLTRYVLLCSYWPGQYSRLYGGGCYCPFRAKNACVRTQKPTLRQSRCSPSPHRSSHVHANCGKALPRSPPCPPCRPPLFRKTHVITGSVLYASPSFLLDPQTLRQRSPSLSPSPLRQPPLRNTHMVASCGHAPSPPHCRCPGSVFVCSSRLYRTARVHALVSSTTGAGAPF